MKRILFVGAEAMPFAATGGLGDVIGSLPGALRESCELDVRVMLPLYRAVGEEWRARMQRVAECEVMLAWRRQICTVWALNHKNVTFYFLENAYYFDRDGLYGHYDDGERFAFFCMAALSVLPQLDFIPDVLHAHDWQAALTVIYLRSIFCKNPAFEGIRTAFTIHNIEYQGRFPHAILGDVFGLGESLRHELDFDGCLNLMKGAILFADRVTTVSPRYATELCDPAFAHGLDAILRENAHKLCGILNGIDLAYYDPERDAQIAAPYSAAAIDGKRACKEALQRELGLEKDADAPLFALVTRLASHKGLELVCGMAEELLREGAQLAVLGCGEARFEDFFRRLCAAHPGQAAASIGYDRALSKRVYAGADLFLMPSRSEPCGLAQMIASRYGAIPVVRGVGGLYDSIKPYRKEGGRVAGNGFVFADYTPEALLECCRSALSLWRDEGAFHALRQRVMRTDFSWENSARRYGAVYEML